MFCEDNTLTQNNLYFETTGANVVIITRQR